MTTRGLPGKRGVPATACGRRRHQQYSDTDPHEPIIAPVGIASGQSDCRGSRATDPMYNPESQVYGSGQGAAMSGRVEVFVRHVVVAAR